MGLEGAGLRASESKFLTPIHPSRPILLPEDKCEIQARWQACRGETDAGSGGRVVITYHQPRLRPASVHQFWKLMKQYKHSYGRTGSNPPPIVTLLVLKRNVRLHHDGSGSCVGCAALWAEPARVKYSLTADQAADCLHSVHLQPKHSHF